MIKKIALLTITSATLSFAVSDEAIVNFYKERLSSLAPDAQISVIKRESLDENGFDKVILQVSSSGESVKEVVFTNGKFLFPDIVDTTDNFSFREDFQKQMNMADKKEFEEKVLNSLANEKFIISIGDKNKPEIFVFSDPECPYCRKHLDGIEKVLEKNRVNFVFVSVHGRSAFEKIANIYKEAGGKLLGHKSDAEKLKIIRKYYKDDVSYPKPTEREYKEVLSLLEKYKALGLKAVPTIIEKPIKK